MISLNDFLFKHLQIILMILFVMLSFLLGGTFLEKAFIPGSLAYIIAIFITFALYKNFNDKFISKIFFITFIVRIITALTIYIIKYYILNLPGEVVGVGIDDDNALYHNMGKFIAENFENLSPQFYLSFLGITESSITFDYSMYSYNLYSLIVGILYKLFGINELVACLFNCFISSFVSIIVYLIGKSTFENIKDAKLIGYITAFSLTVSAYSSVEMRDVFIVLFSYLSIYFSYFSLIKKRKSSFILLIISLFLLSQFRGYAAIAIIFSIIFAFLFVKFKFKLKKNSVIALNLNSIIFLSILPVIIIFLLFSQKVIGLEYVLSLMDTETLLKISEEGYGNATSSFNIDRLALSKCMPLFLLVGYFCMIFAPFPIHWIMVRNVVQAFSAFEMIIYYIFIIPSFFTGIIKSLKDKNYLLIVSIFYILGIYSFYGLILDNAGAVFRGRAPFIPLIFMICLYNSKGLLYKIKSQIIKYL